MATSRVSLTAQVQAGYPEQGTVLNQQNSEVANGNRFECKAGNRLLIARNTNAAARTVTFSYVRRGVVVSQTAVNLAAQHDIAVFGPFPREMVDHIAADAADGDVYVTASGSAGDVKFAVLELNGLTHAPP